MPTRRQLVEKMVPKVVGHKRFNCLSGLTLEQLHDVIELMLNARNEAVKELKDAG